MIENLDPLSWERSRLIPVSGIRNAVEQEQRATSALLAVMEAVNEFGRGLVKELGGPSRPIETFTEVPFTLSDGRKLRPDGVIRTIGGKRSWGCLVEVKTGANDLGKDQIESYLDLAMEKEFDCVLTISNQIAIIPGEHPVDVDGRKLRKVELYHLSWSRILTEAVLHKSHKGIEDRDQAWILGEMIRYMQHEKTGALDFCDMGEHWVGVRNAVEQRTLRSADKKGIEISGKWEELVSFTVLRLGRDLGTDVQEVLSKKEKANPSLRIESIVSELCDDGTMSGSIRIPNTAGDIVLKADLRAKQIVASIKISAPQIGRSSSRINWLLRQLKNTSHDTRIDSWATGSSSSMSELLGDVKQNISIITPANKKNLRYFTISVSRPMGSGRQSRKKSSFIDSVIKVLDEFYVDVVENLKKWTPPTPKMPTTQPPAFEPVTQDVISASELILPESKVALRTETHNIHRDDEASDLPSSG